MIKKRSKRMFFMLSTLVFALVLSAVNYGAVLAAGQNVSVGTASIDGNSGEWDLTNDFFANMYIQGDPTKALVAKSYLRYDCANHRLYVLVLVESGYTIQADPLTNHWATMKGTNTKLYVGNGSIGDGFAFIGLSGTAPNRTATGYEAAFSVDDTGAALAPGTYSDLQIHTEIPTNQTGATTSFKKNGTKTPITLTCNTDYGDLPNTYSTLSANNGARHYLPLVPTLYLGAGVDAETNGQPNAGATGDGSDENGVTIPTLTAGASATIVINASAAGKVNAFIDWNGDGDFADAGETLSELSVAAGNNNLVVAVPAGAATGVSIGARFRLSSTGGLSYTGAAANGEVEDYVVTIQGAGSLKLSKSLNGGPGGYTGPFTIDYNCGAGYTGSVSVSAGSSQTVNGIPQGATCTISETPPTAPTGYTFGTPTFSPSNSATIGSGTTVEVTTNNTLTRDTGSLKVKKNFDANGSGFTGNFSINVDCTVDLFDQTLTLAGGGEQTINGIPTGTTCTVSEPSTPTPPVGWTFGTPVLNPVSGAVMITSKGITYAVEVTNTLTRDTGSLKVKKNFDAKDSGFTGNFSINVDCTVDSFDQTLTLAGGGEQTIGGIPTGAICTVSEPTLPTPPAGWTFDPPTFNPSSGQVTIVAGTSPAEVIVTNIIEKPTAISLISFAAEASATSVTLNWTTATELDSAGYNILRATTANGAYAQVNATLIASQGQGATYSYIDENLTSGDYFYQLVEVDTAGNSTQMGDVIQVHVGAYFMYLPTVVRQ